jgi:hypothetical protein
MNSAASQNEPHDRPGASLQRALWFIGGFDARILRTDACRSVRAKYSCIGGLVLMTAILAVCSGGYTLFTVFDRLDVSLSIAILWGFFILTLDRYLVTTNRKLATAKEFYTTQHVTPPFKERYSVAGLGGLVVRLLLSAAIGLIVAKPIEMAILQPWIQEHEAAKDDATRRRVINESELGTLAREIDRLNKVVEDRQRELAIRREKLSQEVNGERSSGKMGQGVIYRTEAELLAQAEQDYNRELEHLTAARRRRDTERQRTEAAAGNHQAERRRRHSIISDLGAVHELKNGDGTKADLVAAVSFFLTCFFVIVEITPILAKVVAPFDQYDAMLLAEEHEAILTELSAARASHQQARAPILEE